MLKDKKFLKTDHRGSSGNFLFFIACLDSKYEDSFVVTKPEFYKYNIDDVLGERGVVQHISNPRLFATTKALQEDQAIKETVKNAVLTSLMVLTVSTLVLVGLGLTIYVFLVPFLFG